MAHDHPHALQSLALRAGEQVFVNGTLIEAASQCELRLSVQASVVRGAQPRRNIDARRALTHLYQETLRAERDPEGLKGPRPDLLASLNLLTTQMRTRDGQAHCATYATALACGDIPAALTALRGLSHAVRQITPRPHERIQAAHPQIPLAANT